MATEIKIKNRIPAFKTATAKQLDGMLEDMAKEIERNARQIVPHKTGDLQATISTKRMKEASWITASGNSYYEARTVPYARRREFEDNVKFSEPGKQAHYLKDSAEKVFAKLAFYARMHLGKGI